MAHSATMKFSACALLCWAMICVAVGAAGQTAEPGPIRVESNEVLIPVLVLDKARLRQVMDNPYMFWTHAYSGDIRSWEAIPVRHLTAKDFEVSQDGKRQTIASVIPERGAIVWSLGNPGPYGQDIGPGRGIWLSPNDSAEFAAVGRKVTVNGVWRGYVLAYVPPPSSSGKCHEVTVKVDRRDSLVFSRNEYCDVPGAADPLAGTKLGIRLTSELTSTKKNKIPLHVTAFAPLASAGTSRVRVFLKLPRKPLEFQGPDCFSPVGTLDVLGMVYSAHGTLVSRFSDHTYLNGGEIPAGGETFIPEIPDSAGSTCTVSVFTEYETQLDLAPGEYELRVALSERGKFGRAEAHFKVKPFDGKYLAISSIALVKHYRAVPSGVRAAATELPSAFTPLVSKGVEVTPTANTQFAANGPFYFYFEVYEPQQTAPAEIEAHLRILDAQTGQVVKNLKPVDAAPYAKPGDPVIPIGGGIDIAGLAKGSYLLEAQATDSAGDTTPWRTVHFSIE